MDVISLNEMDMKRVSLLSQQQFSIKDPQTQKTKEELAPPDPYHLTHILFFMFSLGSTIPYQFFSTAQDYWMYKFRDTSFDTYDLRNKTMLQKNFLSISSMSHAIPGILVTALTSYYGHKIYIQYRLVGSLLTNLGIFLTFTGFIYVNTDPWQLEFFILTIIVSCGIARQLEFFILTIIVSCGIAISYHLFIVTNLALISRFPQQYMITQIYASACSGILSALLQIFCLYIGSHSPQTTALIYFSVACIIVGLSTVCACVIKSVPRFVYYLGDAVADTKRPTITFAEMKSIAKVLWPNIILSTVGYLTSGMGHPTITTLVVSENYGHGDPWADKYFEPVITFLYMDIIGLLGRYAARPVLTPRNAKWYVMLDSLRILATHPLYLFCNAQPRNHLPVLFPHDWQYILIVSFSNVLEQFFANSTYLSMKNMLPDRAEQGYLFMSNIGILGSIAYRVLSTFWVNMI